MKRWVQKLCSGRWLQECSGMAATETALLLPVMFSMLMGVYDLGQGLVVNHKTINSSQVIGDLITRRDNISMDDLNEAVAAGRLALQPFDGTPMGYDIMSIEFDEDSEPEVLWRVTQNMAGNDTALTSLEDLAQPGEGVVVVTVQYDYGPFFSHFIVDNINMQEVAFLRGRRSQTVLCSDCPAG